MSGRRPAEETNCPNQRAGMHSQALPQCKKEEGYLEQYPDIFDGAVFDAAVDAALHAVCSFPVTNKVIISGAQSTVCGEFTYCNSINHQPAFEKSSLGSTGNASAPVICTFGGAVNECDFSTRK